MSGCAPLVIPPNWHLPILDFRERFARGRMLTLDTVREMDIELRELYFYIEDQVWNPPLPELRNTDGDRLVLTTLTYRLRCSPSAAFDRLKSLARASKDDVTQLLSEAESDDAGQLRAVTIPWSKRGNRLHQDWDNTTLGTLDIDGHRLQVHVNSNVRARRIEREIAKRLGPDAVLESRTADPFEKLLADRKDAPRDPIADLEQQELQRQPEVQEFLRQQGERHWESWLDTRLPALGNRTPRQAAGTPEGRERLEALFAELAWIGEQQVGPGALIAQASGETGTEKVSDRRNAGLFGDCGDIGGRLHAEHRHPGTAEVLQKVAVVAGDLDDLRLGPDAEPRHHGLRVALGVLQPAVQIGREVVVVVEDPLRRLEDFKLDEPAHGAHDTHSG